MYREYAPLLCRKEQFSTDTGSRMLERDVLIVTEFIVPDSVANAGGIIYGSMEYRGFPQRALVDYICGKIRTTSPSILEISWREKTPPRTAEMALDKQRVREALRYGVG